LGTDPILESDEPSPEIEAAIDRVRRSIASLEEYVAGDLKKSPSANGRVPKKG
jgi:hypothetical protein